MRHRTAGLINSHWVDLFWCNVGGIAIRPSVPIINQLIILLRDGLIPSRCWRITAMASKQIDVGTC